MYKCTIIGLTDDARTPVLEQAEVRELIAHGHVFSGGKRHHELVAPLLPDDAVWIDITVPLSGVFEQYALYDDIVVFASGDPLFYGFAATVQRECPGCQLKVIPSFNSLQMLAHRLCLPYADMRCVSLTGRPWDAFDEALIRGERIIGILTDRNKTPQLIRQRMLDYGYDNYRIYVGEHLGNRELEWVREYEDGVDYTMPNCMIAVQTKPHNTRFGLPESEFTLLDGRTKMITKMPIRLLTLQALDLPNRHVLWDIGFCTGSVSIEARLLFPNLRIEAFEVRPECEAIIMKNARRFGTPGINVHIGDFRSVCFDSVATFLPPDAVFIGGHGGHLLEIMQKVLTVLAPGGVIVMNSVIAPKVTTDSHKLWDEACRELGLRQDPPMRIQLDDNHPITILRCRR